MMSRLLLLLSILPLMGVGCFFPQRPHTFIPPTSLEDTCRGNSNYFYSAVYRFCVLYPNENWSRISVSLPVDILGTKITTFKFFSIQENFSVFTLYVADPSPSNVSIFNRELISIIHAEPYLVGYTLNPDDALPPDLKSLQLEVEQIVKTIIFE